MFKYKKTAQVFSAFFILLFIGINFITLKDGHHWGDFSQYIINARNIVGHQPYLQGILLTDVGFVYPPGFPLLLAPLVKCFGLDFIVFKMLNIFLWYLYILCLYPILAKRLDRPTAVLFCLFLASSFYFFMLKQGVLSDIPFVFFITAGFWAFGRYEESQSFSPARLKYFILFLLLMSFSYLVRSAGLVLFVSVFFYFVAVKRDWRGCLGVLVCLGMTVVVQIVLMNGPQLGLFHPEVVKKLIVSNAVRDGSPVNSLSLILKALIWSFFPAKAPLAAALFSWIGSKIIWLSLFVYSGGLAMLVYKIKKKELDLLDCFLFFYIGAIFVWTVWGETAEAMTRFMFPLWAPVFILGAQFFILLGKKFLRLDPSAIFNVIRFFLVAFIGFNVVSTVMFFDFNDDVVYKVENKELYEWMKGRLSPDDHYLFPDDPRPVALLTERTGTTMWMIQGPGPANVNELVHKVRGLDISYWIMSKMKDAFAIDILEDQLKIPVAWENSAYKVFQIK